MTQTESKEISGLDTQRTELQKIYKWIFELGAVALVLFYIYSAGFGVPMSNSISVSISC